MTNPAVTSRINPARSQTFLRTDLPIDFGHDHAGHLIFLNQEEKDERDSTGLPPGEVCSGGGSDFGILITAA